MSSRHSRLGAAALALALLGGGCVAVPSNVDEEFSPPDGKRPNHYARPSRAEKTPEKPRGGS